jgi:hypothetical protein
MRRLILMALALAALGPVAGSAAPALPGPGSCVMVPMKPGNCSYTPLVNGTIAYAIQGAVEFRVTHDGITTRTCRFGSGAGTGPKIFKGDRVSIVGRTQTTAFLSVVAPGNVKPWAGSGKPWAC